MTRAATATSVAAPVPRTGQSSRRMAALAVRQRRTRIQTTVAISASPPRDEMRSATRAISGISAMTIALPAHSGHLSGAGVGSNSSARMDAGTSNSGGRNRNRPLQPRLEATGRVAEHERSERDEHEVGEDPAGGEHPAARSGGEASQEPEVAHGEEVDPGAVLRPCAPGRSDRSRRRRLRRLSRVRSPPTTSRPPGRWR